MMRFLLIDTNELQGVCVLDFLPHLNPFCKVKNKSKVCNKNNYKPKQNYLHDQVQLLI